MLVAVLLLWGYLHSGNRSLRAELERRAAQSTVAADREPRDDGAVATEREMAMAIVLEEPLPEVEEKTDAPEVVDDPIIIPVTVEALAEEVAGLFQTMLNEESDNAAAQAEIIGKVPAIVGAMKVHAEELATPEGAGQLIGGVLGRLASEDAGRRDRIRQLVVDARVMAAESGLLKKEPEDEEEAEVWRKSREQFNKKLVDELMPLVDTDRLPMIEDALSDQAVLIDLQEAVAKIIPEASR